MIDTINLLLSHNTIRSFKNDPIPKEDIERAVRCGQKAATSSFIQAYCAFNINDPDIKKKFVELSGGQRVVENAPHFMVICGDTKRHRLLVERNDYCYESNFESLLLSIIDASIFAQNIVIGFEAMGYGTCYVGGIRNDIPAVAELLSLPIGVYPLFGLCIGKPAEHPIPRPRLPIEAVVFDGCYPDDDSMISMIKDYDKTVSTYYEERGGSINTWSEPIIKTFSTPRRKKTAFWYQKLGAITE
ncbi:MAG: NADPH-dependent oxidoreductase [Phycisphaerales bacterium]|jgi:nitroreductase|nr:NADPH-dependent oxidoreductase [Phycisphaerales bacterium]